MQYLVNMWYYEQNINPIVRNIVRILRISMTVLTATQNSRRSNTPARLSTMSFGIKPIYFMLLSLIFICLPTDLPAMTAQEILDRVAKENFGDSFRLTLTAKTFKGKKKPTTNVLWIMGKFSPELSSFFVEFEKPEESKGLRFLLTVQPKGQPSAFMYLPATGKTVPLAVEDSGMDIGGSGLSMEDIQVFVPKSGEKTELVGEESVDGQECYKIRISLDDNKGERVLWVTKKEFLVMKNNQMGPQGKITRTFQVLKFFKTEQGKEFPRQEAITIPGKDTRIDVTQEHAVFGIEIPDEVMNPEKFGTFKWKL